MGVRTFQQKITAGSNFNGTAPATAPVAETNIEKAWPAGTHGGEFDFEQTEPVLLYQVEFLLGGQSSWSLTKIDADGLTLVLFAGTTETSFATTAADRMLLLKGQKLHLSTVGASGAMTARLSVSDRLY